MSPSTPPTVLCDQHGPAVAAVVCQHLVGAHGEPLGFVENSADPDDLQGWCAACEDAFVAEGGLTASFRLFNDFKVVCANCYAGIKARHSIGG